MKAFRQNSNDPAAMFDIYSTQMPRVVGQKLLRNRRGLSILGSLKKVSAEETYEHI